MDQTNLDNSKNSMCYLRKKFFKYFKKVIIVILTILLVNLFHWLCIQFIYNYCSKPGLWGMVENLFSLGSPVCHFINNIQYNLSNYYTQIWLTSGIGLIGFLSF